jgi:hypothetical protein
MAYAVARIVGVSRFRKQQNRPTRLSNFLPSRRSGLFTLISESQRSTMIAMRCMRSLSNRSSTWAFLTGLLIVPVIDGLRAAFYPNFTDWHYNYNAFWLCAAFVTFVARWVSRTRAEMRAEAEDAAIYRERGVVKVIVTFTLAPVIA